MTLAERLGAALTRGIDDTVELLSGDDSEQSLDGALADAAVLVAITERDEPGVLLTQRSSALRKHPGQIAFPGGRIDPEDDGPIAAALREAEEEIGLSRDVPLVLGTADHYRTGTGFRITPVLAVVPPDLPFIPHEVEVESVFEVPLAFLLDPANQQRRHVQWEGRARTYYELIWGERRIWGATAAMIVNLSRRIVC